jgi:hypothetical protein
VIAAKDFDENGNGGRGVEDSLERRADVEYSSHDGKLVLA